MKRSLSLKREALTELTAGELTSVAGGAITVQGASCPVLRCASIECYGYTYTCCTASASC
jgi:hypothetical protein